MVKLKRLYSKISNYNDRLRTQSKGCGKKLPNNSKCNEINGLCEECFALQKGDEQDGS